MYTLQKCWKYSQDLRLINVSSVIPVCLDDNDEMSKKVPSNVWLFGKQEILGALKD